MVKGLGFRVEPEVVTCGSACPNSKEQNGHVVGVWRSVFQSFGLTVGAFSAFLSGAEVLASAQGLGFAGRPCSGGLRHRPHLTVQSRSLHRCEYIPFHQTFKVFQKVVQMFAYYTFT